MPTIPDTYLPPHNTPLAWQNDPDDALVLAVLAYLGYAAGMAKTCSPEDLALIIAYCKYYINAPCWDSAVPGDAAELLALRQDAEQLKTIEEVDVWLRRALELGIDPL